MREEQEKIGDGVLFSNAEQFQAKLTSLVEGDCENMEIVADFDRTMTMGVRADGGVNASPSVLWEFMPPEYKRRSEELYKKYRPIELDITMPRAEKIGHMETWMSAWQKNTVEFGFSRDIVKKIIQSGMLVERPHLDEFMVLARERNIPMLVFSAGVGDIIREYLADRGLLSSNVHIVSNFAVFDGDGKCISWRPDMMTSETKAEGHALHEEWAKTATRRRNVLLLGDHEGDIRMVDAAKREIVLSVGFLNGEQSHLQNHLKTFDAVVPEDGGFEFPLKILRQIERSATVR